jgi:hypothetical protein
MILDQILDQVRWREQAIFSERGEWPVFNIYIDIKNRGRIMDEIYSKRSPFSATINQMIETNLARIENHYMYFVVDVKEKHFCICEKNKGEELRAIPK